MKQTCKQVRFRKRNRLYLKNRICIFLPFFIILYFLHIVSVYIKFKFRITKQRRLLLVGGAVGAPRAPFVFVPATSGWKKGRMKWWMMKVWWQKRELCCSYEAWVRDNSKSYGGGSGRNDDFSGTSFLASYWIKISWFFFNVIIYNFKEIY